MMNYVEGGWSLAWEVDISHGKTGTGKGAADIELLQLKLKLSGMVFSQGPSRPMVRTIQ